MSRVEVRYTQQRVVVCRIAVRGCGRSVNCSDARLAALSHEVAQLISMTWHGSGSVDCESVQQVFHVGGQKVRTRKEGRKQASRRLGGSTEPAGEGGRSATRVCTQSDGFAAVPCVFVANARTVIHVGDKCYTC